MNLQTNIPLPQQQYDQIDYHSKLVLLGSCFAENIGEKFEYFKFQKLQNPFGILFHPLAIERLITNAINEKVYTKNDIFFHNEQWHCFDAHSKRSHSSEDQLLNDLNAQIKTTHQFLKETTHVIITLGTAWAYRFIDTDTIVANCHKVLQKQFLKELLSVEQIRASLDAIISLIRGINPEVSFIFTVSPVRHIKDGFIENTQSKSHLITAIHHIVDPRHQCYYFPSYEIMMDELRDYRFYNPDMIHPNPIAVQYIWERFQQVWMSSDAQTTMKDVEEIQKGLTHRPFNPESDAHLTFLQQLETKKTLLKSRVSHITF
ncbi:GSCFA domain-containing protein [uncultured Psychroserpens sp.]|uniref:GSCFA domain-containing protein n=1 Tax=uncultured Psychroserpens sp. TaxID=255436 RepID=UPI00260CFFDB|nr:GSCFA domain-containing protein [uncultured Psychroserpens sp.]